MENQTNGNSVATLPKIRLTDSAENDVPEVVEAKQIARRYRLPYIDLLPPGKESPIDYEELARTKKPVLILGSINDVEVGFR